MDPTITIFGITMNPPRSFTIFGFPIYFYAIAIMLGFVLALLYVYKRREAFGMTRDNVLDMFLCVVIAGIIGARLYYIMFNPSEYFGAGKWGNILRFREGGLAIYGGIIFGAGAVAVYAWRKKLRIGALLDAGGLGLLIGQAMGRWGNFVNREAFGSLTALPWGMRLGFTNGVTIAVHPTFLYESLWNAIGLILLHNFSKKRKQYDGQVFLLYLFWYGLGRVWIEGLRTDSLYIGATGIRVSQLLAALCIFCSAGLLIAFNLKRRALATSVAETAQAEENATDDEISDENDENNNIDNEEVHTHGQSERD